MSRDEDNNDVYNNLTEPVQEKSSASNNKWTLYLILCCITVCTASFIFGFNIGSTNLPTPLIKEFFTKKYFQDYCVLREIYSKKIKEEYLDGYNRTENIQTLDSEKNILVEATANSSRYFLGKYNLELYGPNGLEMRFNEAKYKVDEYITFLWTLTTALFVVGGMIGAFTSKNVADVFGRKKGIIFHHVFTLIGAILVLVAPYINSPECVIISRFVYGIQGGMSCGLIPTYLSEISPANLRGATGVIHQLFLTIGILTAQTLGFRQLLGVESLWHLLLALPLIPGILGGLSLLFFFPESPRALLMNNRDEDAARQALQRLRNATNVSHEIDEMNQEARENKSDESISLIELLTSKELRWPLATGLLLQLAQQLCGINAIFFYSEGIFRAASIQSEHIQYAVVCTGTINVICTIVCVPLIDRLGRKPLLVYPMILMIFDFILLTVFLTLQSRGMIYSYLSIVCIIVFIMCFALGLGPIPFIYVAECFKQDSRSAALAICMFANWVANLLLTLTFPYLAKFLTNYVFLVFTAIVALTVAVIFKKVPETKGRSVDEIMAHFQGRKSSKYTADESGKLMSNTKV